MYEECEKKLKTKRLREETATLDAHFINNDTRRTVSENSALRKPKVITFKSSAAEIQQLAVEAVTLNGLPLSVFEKSSIKKLLKPMLVATGISLNRKSVRELTLKMAKKRVYELKEKVKGQLLCLKVDLCTRKGRHFIGINVQTIINGTVEVFTLKVKEMFVASTAEEIKLAILNSLAEIGVDISQIYAITTDNGSNVLKTSRLLNLEAQEREAVASSSNDDGDSSSGETEDEEETVDSTNIMVQVEVILESAVASIAHQSNWDQVLQPNTIISSIKCAAHTLQLAANDVLKEAPFRSVINAIRKVVKKTRNQNLRLVFRRHNQFLPVIDCETRWVLPTRCLKVYLIAKTFSTTLR